MHDLARHGAYGETGIWRTVYSPEWVAARDEIAGWMRDAGLDVRVDEVGNLWGRVDGSDGGKSIVTGSHIDSQRPGGRFDGVLGVSAGVVAVRALLERFGRPKRTLEVVALCEEESSRFPTAGFWGSRALTGGIAPGDVETTVDWDGMTIAEAMREVGLDPDRAADAARDDIDAFIELHIEQGPLLEQQELPVAVVTAITGIRSSTVTVKGVANHAGAFPMDLRRDPMAGAAEMISGVINTAHRFGRPAVTTVGRISAEPNYPPIVPEKVTFSLDARSPDPEQRARLYAAHEGLIREVAERRGLEVAFSMRSEHEPCRCDPELFELFCNAAIEQGVPFTTMHSGAAHDSQQMAKIARVQMLFVQSKDGRSHTPEEFTTTEHATLGVQVLAAGLHKLAY
ncbi:MAG: hydantoinase/carbamoylase family amidase [Thermomicrobiales bacterium]|nr:hydantoinase/carbamoylase family amidase [Thermomicrobiales bacterium]